MLCVHFSCSWSGFQIKISVCFTFTLAIVFFILFYSLSPYLRFRNLNNLCVCKWISTQEWKKKKTQNWISCMILNFKNAFMPMNFLTHFFLSYLHRHIQYSTHQTCTKRLGNRRYLECYNNPRGWWQRKNSMKFGCQKFFSFRMFISCL